MTSPNHARNFGTAVRVILSSTPFFTLACFAAAIALLMAQPNTGGSDTEAASTKADVSDAERIAEATIVTREQQPQAGYGN